MKLEIVAKKNPKKEGYIIFDKNGNEKIVFEVDQGEMNRVINKIIDKRYGKRHSETDSL